MNEYMESYMCDRCGYHPKTKSNLKLHFQLKRLCKPLLSEVTQEEMRDKYFSVADKLKCDAPTCTVYLRSERTKRAHHKRCRHMAKWVCNQSIELVGDSHHNPKMARDDHSTTVNNGDHNTNNCNNHNTTTNITQNITNYITVNAFGEEKVDHLNENSRFIWQCLTLRKYGLLDYIDRKYFDLMHPENMTINKPTKRDALVQCSTGSSNEYTSRLLSDVTGAIVDGYGSDISNFLDHETRNGKELKPPTLLRHFMVDVGGPLNMDLSPHDERCGYDERKWTDKQREKKKRDLHKLMDARLYENSTKTFRAGVAPMLIASSSLPNERYTGR